MKGSGTSGQTIDPVAGLAISQGIGTATARVFVQTTPSRGLERDVTGQVIGSCLYKQGDVRSENVTLSSSGLVNGQTVFFCNHNRISSGWMGDRTTQFMPMLRGFYSFRHRFTFDTDLSYQQIDTSGPQVSASISSLFCFGGLGFPSRLRPVEEYYQNFEKSFGESQEKIFACIKYSAGMRCMPNDFGILIMIII